MSKTIDYFFTPVSPWAYLGHERFTALARQHGATVVMKPMDLSQIFPVSGGLPLPKRAPQRQAYRLQELARWREFLGIPINVQPKFLASGPELASRYILAACEHSADDALALAGAIMRARWAEDRDIADAATLDALAGGLGQDAPALAARAVTPNLAAAYDATTQDAIDRQIFGAPTYVIQDELFWGQDRLDFLARKLAK
ncbi:MAG: 2-hydroxychromene-2-carboxylate isomerase [Betaproteobacteria bacterium]